jgi:hypothetical protein
LIRTGLSPAARSSRLSIGRGAGIAVGLHELIIQRTTGALKAARCSSGEWLGASRYLVMRWMIL